MRIDCPKCRKEMEPYIDKTDKVYCELCEKDIEASHFLKMQLKTLKQYRKKVQESFSVKCTSCEKEGRPLLINDAVCCKFCKKAHTNLSHVFISMLKTKLPSIDK